jgi:Peptidase C13 family
MDSLSFSADLTLEDWRALQAAARARSVQVGTRMERLLLRVPALAIAILLVGGASWLSSSSLRLAWVAGILAALVLVVTQGLWVARQYRPLANGIFLGQARFDLDAQGFRQTRLNTEGLVRWPQFVGVDLTRTHLFLWCDLMTGYVLPLRALPEGVSGDMLVERIREFMRSASPAVPVPFTVQGSAPVTTRVAAPGESQPPGTRVRGELLTLLRALFLLPVDGARIVGSDRSIFAATFILLAIWIPLDPLVFPGDLEFGFYDALPGLAWIVAGVLGFAWILSRLSLPPVEYRRTLLLTIGAMPIAMASSTIFALVEDRWLYLIVALTVAWLALYFKRALRAMTRYVQVRAMITATVATFAFMFLGGELNLNPSFWHYADEQDAPSPEETAAADPRDWQRMEELQFEQQARLDAELDRIDKLPKKSPAMYFVGFAGYGEQREFTEEIELAAQRVGARFGVGGRSLLLANDRRDPERLPLASAPSLRYALLSLGEMMGKDDVLFLALSSHGSEDGSISVSNVGRVPVELAANDLADMLKEAKIPWKVIVVSSCYAGGFIDALRDEHTIVLAAAAPDRTSFGCADDRDLTYFGEAFYRDALPKAASLHAAFDAAKSAIAKREKAEGELASDPRAFFAPDLEKKLAALEPSK